MEVRLLNAQYPSSVKYTDPRLLLLLVGTVSKGSSLHPKITLIVM